MLSATAAEHVHSPRNVGPLPGATHIGNIGTPGDGPYMTLWFEFDGDHIKNAAWAANSCPSSMACASMTAQILKGRTVEQALLLTAGDLDLLLGGLPEGKGACAQRAIDAVRKAFGGKES